MKICQDCRLNLILENNSRRIISGPTITYSNQWRIQHFTEWGDNSQSGCANLLFCNFFAKNCMEMKEFGPRRGCIPGARFDPPMPMNTACTSREFKICTTLSKHVGKIIAKRIKFLPDSGRFLFKVTGLKPEKQ